MYSKQDLINHLRELGLRPTDTLLIHSSMKAVGEVDGGADTVLDAFSEYLSQGLLVLPTHTWAQMNDQYRVFDVENEPSCVGILTELFRKRPGVVRSWHPTHSLAALGQGAEEFIQGEERFDSPCAREGCYGKLYDRGARVLFLGVELNRNTIIHGVEEWANITNRLTAPQALQVRTPDGRLIDRPMRRHGAPVPNIHENYVKLTKPLLELGIAMEGKIGDAKSILIDIKPMCDLTLEFLKREPDLFLDKEPIPTEWLKG